MTATAKNIVRIATEDPTQKLAVLIDADNAQPVIIEGLLEEIARFGEATVKRIYGDFTSNYSTQWKNAINKFAIKPVQQFAYTTGKNATDSAMIIDAMDLLYTGRFDGFCLVSSDSDFTGIAMRIREQGLSVYGFGEQKTPEAFRNACHKFIFTEVLRPTAYQPVKTPNKQKEPPTPTTIPPAQPETPPVVTPERNFPVEFFRRALEQASDENGWAHLGEFGSYLTKLKSDFDPRLYGCKKLSDLVRAHNDLFEIEERSAPGSKTKDLYIRAK